MKHDMLELAMNKMGLAGILRFDNRKHPNVVSLQILIYRHGGQIVESSKSSRGLC